MVTGRNRSLGKQHTGTESELQMAPTKFISHSQNGVFDRTNQKLGANKKSQTGKRSRIPSGSP
ncbi:MAG: hypothetical protein DWI02_02110 [Planctomycetota bacterium]|nr:MAG: hypothetical protein DWI02_02110 [Planctomycetota bacterium]